MIGTTITLVHRGTNEHHEAPIEYVCRTYVSIRWGQSGIYDLNLLQNVLTARSHAARRRGGNQIKWWSAVDIVAVREAVHIYCDGEDKRVVMRRLSEAHERRKADEWAARNPTVDGRAKRIDG